MWTKNSKKKNAKKITTIFTIAFAVRKFQKFESNSYKKSLAYTFDKEELIDNFKRDYSYRKDFFLKDIYSFVYAIRKFKLNFTDFKFVDNFPNELINLTKTNRTYSVLLSQSLKYLIMNNKTCDIDLKLLVDTLRTVRNDDMVYSIGILIEKASKEIESCLISEIKDILSSSDFNAESKSFVFEIIEKTHANNNNNLADHFNYENEISVSTKAQKKQQEQDRKSVV